MQGTEGDASREGGVRGRMQRRVQGGCEQHGGSGGGASRARCRPQGRRPQGGGGASNAGMQGTRGRGAGARGVLGACSTVGGELGLQPRGAT